MKKRSKAAQKCTLRSRGTKALLCFKLNRFEQFSKYRVSLGKSYEVWEMTRENINRLRGEGFQIRVFGKSNKKSLIIRAVKGNRRVYSKDKFTLLERAPNRSVKLQRQGCVICKADDGFTGYDTENSLSSYDIGSSSTSISYNGSEGPNDRNSEKKFLVMILIEDEKQRNELKKLLAQLDKKDAIIRNRLKKITAKANKEDVLDVTQRKKKVFLQTIPENEMADALYEVYEKILGNNEKAREKNYGLKPIDLIAYLYIMVDIKNYGRYDFHENGKQPFFEFFIEKVRPELKNVHGVTRRTMSNRINQDFSWLYLSPEGKKNKPEKLQKKIEEIEKAFNTICGIFHNTKLGKKLASPT